MTEIRYKRLRQNLHMHPELSGKEFRTSELINKELKKTDPDSIIDRLGGTGVLACFNANEPEVHKTLLIRAELDAIAVKEENEFAYISQTNGVMHGCGHDGHMAILIGLARWLKNNRPDNLNICLLFQPAEETGTGASKVINDDRFADLSFDHAFALHNLPGFAENEIFLKKGVFACASSGVEVTFKGCASHAAYPEQGVNPVQAVNSFISSAEKCLKKFRETDELNKAVCTFIKMGEPAFGISPGSAKIGYTLRSVSDEELKEGTGFLKEAFEHSRRSFEGNASFKQVEPFSATINDDFGTEIVMKGAEIENIPANTLNRAFPWSEDFGEFRKCCPITIFGLGAGKDHPPLHSEKYDFNDALIETGIRIFSSIIKEYASNYS